MTTFEQKQEKFENPFILSSESKYEPRINDCTSVQNEKPNGFLSGLPDEILKHLPDPKLAITSSGVNLGRRVLFVHDDHGDVLDRTYEANFEFVTDDPISVTFGGYSMPWLEGGKVVVSEAFGDLASAEHDKAWINALNVSARFFGGARPEQYNPTDARAVSVLAALPTSPMRFLVRLANVYLSSYLEEMGVIARRGGWNAGVEVVNVNNQMRHGELLVKASMNNRDIIWAPNDITDMRRIIAILSAASAATYPYSNNAVLASFWPPLNRPTVGYCAMTDSHSHLEEYSFNSAEVMLVANMYCNHFGWTDQWNEALSLVAVYSVRSPRFKVALASDKVIQKLPISDLRACGLGPMITAKGGIYFEAPAYHRPEYLLVAGAVRKLCLSTFEASAVEAMGFQYAQLGLAKSLIRSLSLRARVYDSGTVFGSIAAKFGELAGWKDINRGALMFRSVDTASSVLMQVADWRCYPGWHLTSSLGLRHPEFSDADLLNSLARITDMALVSNDWHEVKSTGINSLKVLMALQMIGGQFQYEIRSPGRALSHRLVEVAQVVDGSYMPTIPLKIRKEAMKADLLFKANDVVDVFNWNTTSKKFNEASKFILPFYQECNLLDDWYGNFDAPADFVEKVLPTKELLHALPAVPRYLAVAERVSQYFPELGGALTQLAEGRAVGPSEESMYALSKASLQDAMGWKDLVRLTKGVPIDDRYEAAQSLAQASALLRDTLEERHERKEAIESGVIADNLVAAMKVCPALTMDEFRSWGKARESPLGRAAWPNVPTPDDIIGFVKTGEPLNQWLLRNNQGWDPTKAPSKSSTAIKKHKQMEEARIAAASDAKERLRARLGKKIDEGSNHHEDKGRADEETETASNREQDFQSALSYPAAPSPQPQSPAPVVEQSISKGVIEFGVTPGDEGVQQ